MHVFSRCLGAGVPHQVPQHQQVDSGRGQLRAVGVPQPVRAHPGRARTGPVGAKDPTHPSLGQRLPRGRPAQHDEALLGRAIRRSLKPKISSEFGEERPVHRHHPFPTTLADHPNLPATDIHLGQQQTADLSGAQSAEQHQQHHRAVAVSAQVGQKRLNLCQLKAFRQQPLLAHQPAARPWVTSRDMPQQAPTRPKPAAASRRRHRAGRHHAGDHRELEQSTHRGDAPVLRRWGSAPPLGQPDHRRTRSALGLGLPVQIVEQVHRPHLGQTYTLPGEESQEVQHVIRIRAPRRPGEVPALQMRQKPVHHRDVVALPAGDITGEQEDVAVAGYPKPHRHLQAESHRPPVSAPTCLAGGTSHAPRVSPWRGPVNG